MIGVREFFGEHRFLSNFWHTPVTFEGVLYKTVEHAYQAAKLADPADRVAIQMTDSPALAKKLVKTMGARWTRLTGEDRIRVMDGLLRQKFAPGTEEARLLAALTGPIQEGNRWGDIFWGVDLRTGHGQNHMGKLLMAIRDELQVASL